jgi:hypothetical protein
MTSNDYTETGVPEDGAFDGDATSSSMASGVAPRGNDSLPDGSGQPPQDGGVMGAVGNDGVPASTPDGETTGDRGAGIPPEEQGR